MSNTAELDSQLTELVKQGKILESLAKFYDENYSFQEGNETPRIGRQNQHDHLAGFFATLKSFTGATLHSQGVGSDTTLTEWTFDMEGPDGPILWNEILRRQWENGKVVSERFYTA